MVTQAESVCATLKGDLDARGEFPVDDFDPANPSQDALPVVGDYFASANAATEKALQSLRRLDPPTEIQPELDALTDAMAAQLASAKQQVAAAQNSDVAGFTATLAAATETIQNVDNAATRLAQNLATRDPANGPATGAARPRFGLWPLVDLPGPTWPEPILYADERT